MDGRYCRQLVDEQQEEGTKVVSMALASHHNGHIEFFCGNRFTIRVIIKVDYYLLHENQKAGE